MSVQGLSRLMRRFEALPKEVKDDVRDIVEETTLAIQRQAIQNAPAAGDTLKTTYGMQKINTGINQFIFSRIEESGLAGSVGIDAQASNLAAYVEFGTGVSAANYIPELDPEFQAIARKYFVNGRGSLLKAPFLLPAYFTHSATFIPKIKKSLENIKL